jgi:Mrp family chromosome partitioning ATPase
MNGFDQAFISAYSGNILPAPIPTTESGDSSAAKPRETPPSPKRTRHRVDAGHESRSPIPAPHAPFAPQPRMRDVSACSVEIVTWDVDDAMPTDNAFVAANVFAEAALPRATENPAAAEPETKIRTVAEPQAEPPAAPAEAPVAPSAEKRVAPPIEQAEAPRDVEQDMKSSVTHEDTAGGESFKPVWEVDGFSWPTQVEDLYVREANYFRYAGQKLREANQEGLLVLGISSSNTGEGCTTLALCLARAAADAGIKVALMDLDLDQPQLAAQMGVRFEHCWLDAMDGDLPLGEAAIASLESDITLLPLNRRSVNSGAALSDPRVGTLVRSVAQQVDLVILDLGALAASKNVADQPGQVCPLDAAIVVRDMRHTSKQQTLATATQLRSMGVAAVGIAENHCPPQDQKAAA